MNLPHGWTLSLTAACVACHKAVSLPGELSLPRVKNRLREAGWRYQADCHGWACSEGCLVRLERETAAAGYGPAA